MTSNKLLRLEKVGPYIWRQVTDPVRRIFERIRIRRRQYSVLGPNSLWHHDGQHGQYSQHMPLRPILILY